jgi:hypothetical protein
MKIKTIYASVDIHREIPETVKSEDLFHPDYYLTLTPHLHFVIHEYEIAEENEEYFIYKDKEHHPNRIKIYKIYDKEKDADGDYDERRGYGVLNVETCHELEMGRASGSVHTVSDDLESVKEKLAAYLKEQLLRKMKRVQQLITAIDDKNTWKNI